MDTNTVQILESLGTKVDGYIATVAGKLGQTAEHFWPLFVKQQQIEGYGFFAIWGILLIVAFALYLIVYIKRDKEFFVNNGDYPTIKFPTIKFFSCFAAIVLSIGLMVNIFSGGKENLCKILNPEYAAFKEVVSMVKFGQTNKKGSL